jgi:hypothetical protein
MSTNWIAPVGADISKVLNLAVFQQANQNVGEGVVDGQAYDPTDDNRADHLMAQAVAQIRAAIQNAGSVPLSCTAGSVPPEAERYAIDIAAYQLIISTPNLKMVIITEKGTSSPFAIFYREAMEWVEKVRKGAAVTPPTDPCGADWANSVGVTLNAVPATAAYDVNGYYALAVRPDTFYTYTLGANDTNIIASGAVVSSASPVTFKAQSNRVLLKGTAGATVTATLTFDNPPIPGMVRYGFVDGGQEVNLQQYGWGNQFGFPTSDLGQP